MRVFFVVALVVAVALSGCATSKGPVNDQDPVVNPGKPPISVGDVTAIANSTIIKAAGLPFSKTFDIPEGITMVRFVADPLSASTIGVSMKNDETGRRRCNQQTVIGFDGAFTGARSCSSITAMDAPGTTWQASASGTGSADIRIDFYASPVDGPAGLLNLSLLSKATYDLEPTQYFTVPSFDGTPLWVEVTKPIGPGPWPTVIASSPYNGETGRGQTPAMWDYWTQDWAKRGYVALNVDVRGYGMSGGCVEVWGVNEQKDQAFIVDWVAEQPWSDGNVGFYGQSYVGTTPVAAAVQAPEALKAIIAVAPVINSYEDWHFGGVPNGESALSPVAYQVLTAAPAAPDLARTDMTSFLAQATSGICDPSLLPRANDPRAVYNEFYEERDFKLRAGDIKAAVLFTEGFEDANVKSAMIPGWFNEINAPKLGVFGHWVHQHPARMDQEALFLGWMDQYVKGVPIGFERLPDALISADDAHHRGADAWPPVDGPEATYGFDLTSSELSPDGDGKGSVLLDLNPVPAGRTLPVATLDVTLTSPPGTTLPLVAPRLEIAGTLNGENAFLYAELFEKRADGSQRILTWGQLNLALRNGYDSYEPLSPAQSFTATLPFRPTELIVGDGSSLILHLRGVQAGEVIGVAQPQPAVLELDGAGTRLVIPTVPLSDYTGMPISARP